MSHEIPFLERLEDDLLEHGWDTAQGHGRRPGRGSPFRLGGPATAAVAFVAVLVLVGLPWLLRDGSPLPEADRPVGTVDTTGNAWRFITEADASVGRSPLVITDTPTLLWLWTTRQFDGGPPEIDFSEDVIVTFEAGVGGGPDCPQPELSDVAITPTSMRAVFGDANPTSAGGVCPASYTSRTFVAAVAREALPEPGYEISAQDNARTVVTGDLRRPGSSPEVGDLRYIDDLGGFIEPLGRWRLAAAEIDNTEIQLDPGNPVTLDISDLAIKGSGICADHRGGYRTSEMYWVRESEPVTGAPSCPVELGQADALYHQSLDRVLHHTADLASLTLEGPGVRLMYDRIPITGEPDPPTSDPSGTWRLIRGVNGADTLDVDPEGDTPILVIDGNAIRGTAGCNTYNSKGRTRIGDGLWETPAAGLYSTAAACFPDTLMVVEDLYIDALTRIDRYVAGDQTLLLEGHNAILIFQRSPGGPEPIPDPDN